MGSTDLDARLASAEAKMRADGRDEAFIQATLDRMRQSGGGTWATPGKSGGMLNSAQNLGNSTKVVVKKQLPYAGAVVGGLAGGPAGAAAGYNGGKMLANEIDVKKGPGAQGGVQGGPGAVSADAALTGDEQRKAQSEQAAAGAYLKAKADAAMPRAAPQIAAPGTLPGTRIAQPVVNQRNQQDAISRLQTAADGTVPSAAELQLKRQAGLDQARQFGMAAALQNGRSVGGALNQASTGAARVAADAGMTAAIARAQEQATARGQLAQAAEGARSQDITVNTNQAQLTQDAAKTAYLASLDVNKANAGLTLDGRKMDDQLSLSRDELYQRGVLANTSLAQGIDATDLDGYIAKYGWDQKARAAKDGANAAMLSSGLEVGSKLWDSYQKQRATEAPAGGYYVD